MRQAVELMTCWAPIDPEDALELLGPNFADPTVRKYAVSRLSHAPDEVNSLKQSSSGFARILKDSQGFLRIFRAHLPPSVEGFTYEPSTL